jgi:hypothetical protein
MFYILLDKVQLVIIPVEEKEKTGYKRDGTAYLKSSNGINPNPTVRNLA